MFPFHPPSAQAQLSEDAAGPGGFLPDFAAVRLYEFHSQVTGTLLYIPEGRDFPSFLKRCTLECDMILQDS